MRKNYHFFSLEKGEKTFNLLEESYRSFYKNDPKSIAIANNRATKKGDEFYNIIKTDINKYVGKGISSLSASRLWDFFHYEDDEKRTFEKTKIEFVDELTYFYKTHVFNTQLKKAIPINKFKIVLDYLIEKKKVIGFVVTILSLLFFSINFFTKNDKQPETDELIPIKISSENIKPTETSFVSSCYFSDNDKYKILIVPFRSFVTDNNVKKDIGAVIEERLSAINIKDSLNLNIHYCKDFAYNKNANDEDDLTYYKNVMAQHNANHIIYGTSKDVYDNKNPELTEVKLNYCTDKEEELVNLVECDNQYNYKLTTLENIYQGELLENIEYLLYWNFIIASIRSSKLKKALLYLTKIEELIGTSNIDILKVKAHCHRWLNQNKKALAVTNKAIEDYPENKNIWAIYDLRANLKWQMSDKTAITDLEEALKTVPRKNIQKLYANMGLLTHELEKDYETALAYYDKSISLESSKYAKAYLINLKQKISFERGEYYEALNLCEEAIDLNTEGVCYWANKASILYALGNMNEALNTINYSISLDPSYYRSYVWKGKILKDMGQTERAILNFKKVLTYYLDSDTYQILFLYYMGNEKYQDAIDLSDTFLEKHPKNVLFLFNKMQVYNEIPECDLESKSLMNTIFKLSPTTEIFLNKDNHFINLIAHYDSLSNKEPALYYNIRQD